jgi:hypothetical protein
MLTSSGFVILNFLIGWRRLQLLAEDSVSSYQFDCLLKFPRVGNRFFPHKHEYQLLWLADHSMASFPQASCSFFHGNKQTGISARGFPSWGSNFLLCSIPLMIHTWCGGEMFHAVHMVQTSRKGENTGLPTICKLFKINESHYVGFEVLIAVVMKSTIFWDVTSCRPLKVNRRFGGTYHLRVEE